MPENRRMTMSEDQSQEAFNMSMRKFLKQVGVTSQREIEKLVDDSQLRGKGKLPVRIVLTAEGTDLEHIVEGEIDLG
jgi:16S rRNA U516 pseudouridylate synthase RsuA-like enzyme